MREYIIFDGDYKSFRQSGGSIHNGNGIQEKIKPAGRRTSDSRWREEARRNGFGGKKGGDGRIRIAVSEAKATGKKIAGLTKATDPKHRVKTRWHAGATNKRSRCSWRKRRHCLHQTSR